jgi:hypothetical protein
MSEWLTVKQAVARIHELGSSAVARTLQRRAIPDAEMPVVGHIRSRRDEKHLMLHPGDVDAFAATLPLRQDATESRQRQLSPVSQTTPVATVAVEAVPPVAPFGLADVATLIDASVASIQREPLAENRRLQGEWQAAVEAKCRIEVERAQDAATWQECALRETIAERDRRIAALEAENARLRQVRDRQGWLSRMLAPRVSEPEE